MTSSSQYATDVKDEDAGVAADAATSAAADTG